MIVLDTEERVMKILILNGSPRRGNTDKAVEVLSEAAKTKYPDADIRVIKASTIDIEPCIACDVCKTNGGLCVQCDRTNDLMNDVMATDMVIFASPVYWWGITAQMKVLLDKFYAKSSELKEMNKKLGTIMIGSASPDGPQYRIIAEQFECIANHLGWDYAFKKAVSAGDRDDLAGDETTLREIQSLI